MEARIGRTTLMALVAAAAGICLALGIVRTALRVRLAVLLPKLLLACVLTPLRPPPLNLAARDIAPVVSGQGLRSPRPR